MEAKELDLVPCPELPCKCEVRSFTSLIFFTLKGSRIHFFSVAGCFGYSSASYLALARDVMGVILLSLTAYRFLSGWWDSPGPWPLPSEAGWEREAVVVGLPPRENSAASVCWELMPRHGCD